MAMKPRQNTLVSKIASKRVLEENARSLQAYSGYKKAADIIERAEAAAGKRLVFRSDTGSTLNFEIDPHGADSTMAQRF